MFDGNIGRVYRCTRNVLKLLRKGREALMAAALEDTRRDPAEAGYVDLTFIAEQWLGTTYWALYHAMRSHPGWPPHDGRIHDGRQAAPRLGWQPATKAAWQLWGDGIPVDWQKTATRRGDWEHFTAWCHANQCEPLPATAETLTRWVKSLIRDEPPPAGITQAVIAVRAAHAAAGEPAPDALAALVAIQAYRVRLDAAVRAGQAAVPPAVSPVIFRSEEDPHA